ncbi:18 kDa heat shock protein [Sporotomaculum syntrophicum]|uniref:18 kDa heat shock protein n=1 Tax=Sporotomaculum syntrophicum TaxID=182264 RepID=A0A9D2WRU2_9FIRM|nr:heat shock protein Hsp18 [Sporotomaculum syntrophicum]KAF1086209.1 18 kDa heat shock protein [Sporotomaculum syntrophicum]
MFNIVPFKRGLLRRGEDFFDHFFDSDFFAPVPFEKFGFGFKVDIKENENAYLVEADLPGVNKDSINIEFENNYLTVSATREDTTEEKTENYVRKERKYGELKRTFYVDDVDEEKIKASFVEGVLKIELPKAKAEKAATKKIEIE